MSEQPQLPRGRPTPYYVEESAEVATLKVEVERLQAALIHKTMADCHANDGTHYSGCPGWEKMRDEEVAALMKAVESMSQKRPFLADSDTGCVQTMQTSSTVEDVAQTPPAGPRVLFGCRGDGHCEHTICAFCGQEIETERKPRMNHGWLCSACAHWQHERYCQLCKGWY